MQEVDALVSRLRKAGYNEREPVKQELLALARGPEGAKVREHLESVKRGELLEIQWEIEEVIDATAPKKPEAPKKQEAAPPPPPPEDPNRPLTAKDLVLVYDDPRGLMLHKAKVGERWFATQFDPRSGQPQTFELHPQEIAQLKAQLQGSPYWVIGAAGAAPPAAAPPGKAPAR
ncbi:MAG: hypothetical protein ACOZNI_37065 [Myxococcota bacterium]